MRCMHNREKNHQHYEGFKEFVEHQEHLGNTILIPKINEDVVFIREKDSNFILVYNIKTKLIVRKFELTLD